MRHRNAPRALVLSLLAFGPLALGANQCGTPITAPPIPTGKPLFTSPQANPVALSDDGTLLYVANTTTGTLSFVDVSNPAAPRELAQVPVGIDPVGVAVRPKVDPANASEDELVFVTNHISDSISVVSRTKRAVVQTLQELEHADGGATPDDLVSTTDEPVGVAFAGPCRAFVTLDQPNQVLVLAIADGNGNGQCDDATGRWSIAPTRLPISAQAPRALAVADGKLFVASFESGNRTEFPTCAETDPRFGTPTPFDPNDPYDAGCEFRTNLIDNITFTPRFAFDLGTIFDFAARDPNIGGRVIRDGDIPDRDLFVFDLAAPGFDSDGATPGVQPAQAIQHLGTLLYAVAPGANGRVYVTHTDGRNHLNGLAQLGNRMFENRLGYVDCAGGVCGAPVVVDLDAGAQGLGATVPTPYGLAVSGDGETLVVTAAGSDGKPGLPGFFTLDADGAVVGSALVGAIPQGVALRSAPDGRGDRAFVLNTVDSTLSVVDVRSPASPAVEATIPVGADPTPAAVKAGRIAFSSARGSTSGTFSCESCHPNGNIDQLLWTINAVEGPDDVAGVEPPEPRTTQPIRGLRDTLPLHWEGRLADPLPGVGADLDPQQRPNLIPGDTAPDCDLAVDGEVGCIRHLVNASLSGVMCAQPDCPVGPSGLKGSYTNQERNEMASFLQAVSYPPPPRRRPSDRLSAQANLGVQEFFTNEDGKGIGTGLGGSIGFGVVTCADNAIGCHSLPLTTGTNSRTVGFFDAPTARGMWDRFLLFSNGVVSSEEFMRLAQDCANGNAPGEKLGGLVTGDPCNVSSPIPIALMPPGLYPSGEHIYDPAEGYTERGAFMATFEAVFALAYGVPAKNIWEMQVEMGTGLAGLVGRQVELHAGNANDPDTLAQIAQLEQAAGDDKIVAIARTAELQELRFDPASALWKSHSGRLHFGTAELRNLALTRNAVFTLTAAPPAGITGGGPDRQPLLDIDPDVLAAEMALTTGQAPGIPKPTPNAPATFRVGAKYLEPGASVLVNGAVCAACSWTPATAASGAPAADVSVPQGFAPGMNVLQMQNPGGWASNELPVLAK